VRDSLANHKNRVIVGGISRQVNEKAELRAHSLCSHATGKLK
jgi:hypothetical protein